jgi:hypothetical protein
VILDPQVFQVHLVNKERLGLLVIVELQELQDLQVQQDK